MAVEITDSNFESLVLQSKKPVLVDFWAPWCGPCRALGPIIDDIAVEYASDIVVGKLNVDENKEIPGKYGIKAIPTILFFINGEVIDYITGSAAKDAIIAMLKEKVLKS